MDVVKVLCLYFDISRLLRGNVDDFDLFILEEYRLWADVLDRQGRIVADFEDELIAFFRNSFHAHLLQGEEQGLGTVAGFSDTLIEAFFPTR